MNSEFTNSLEFANQLDENDKLKHFREKFYIPIVNDEESIYLTGNSLGLQPRTTQDYVLQELEDWANFGVEGHFHARKPWFSYHEIFANQVANIVGALPQEVVVMNQLTVNLHLLLVSFYKPTAKRYKILCEAKAFPSDQYALESQVKHHGFKPEHAIIEIKARDGEHTVRTEDILFHIEKNADELALVMIGGVNYYTGQVFDMETITKAAHGVGALAGFDLAHAAGNIKLELHKWNVDFACWCSYKYLNSGPGGVSGVYINKKHVENKELNRFAGWWGHDKQTRFLMEKGFNPIASAEGWQLSNAPILSMAAHKASLDIFEEAGMDNLVEKGNKLASYLQFIIAEINKNTNGSSGIEILTPTNVSEHGCQVSLLMHKKGKEVFSELINKGVIADWREPNVIRVAPVPLYNTFTDVWHFGQIINSILN
ncbi:MAG: kynureninase [Bacteroidota bacterium]